MGRRRRAEDLIVKIDQSGKVVALVPGDEELGGQPESLDYDQELQEALLKSERLLGLTLSSYQAQALRTRGTFDSRRELLNFSALEIASEAGEVANKVYKHTFQGHDLDREGVIEELGDVLWGLASMAEAVGVSLHDVAIYNIDKLKVRYPDDRFTTADSIIRRDHSKTGRRSPEIKEGGGTQGA